MQALPLVCGFYGAYAGGNVTGLSSYLVPDQRTKWASAANRRTLRVSRPRGRYMYPKLFTARRRAVVGVTGRFWSKDAGQSQTCESNSDPTSSAIIGYPPLRS